jgi:hypothetical protein
VIADASSLALGRLQSRLADSACVAALAIPLVLISARNGGYFPTAWGWSAFFFGWAALMTVTLVRSVRVTLDGILFLGTLAAFGLWALASAVWSESPSASALECERMLVYLGAVGALTVLARSIDVALAAGGLLVAATGICTYSLATRLFPERAGRFDPVAGYRLSTPVGYWNALGLVAAIATVLALGLAARGRGAIVRASAAATLVVLLPTIYFTFSRGAWLALGLAFVFLIAVDSRRLQLLATSLVCAVCPAAALLAAWRSTALTSMDAAIGTAAGEGHRLAVFIVALAVASALLVTLVALVERRVVIPPASRRLFVAVLLVAATTAVAAAMAAWGPPWSIASRTWTAFVSAPPDTGQNLNRRLFQLSGTGRIDDWRIALREFRSSPLLGTGAGTYENWWMARRPQATQIRDAHSLYFETLGELGAVGLGLLVVVLLVPLRVLWQARREPLIPFVGAALVAWMAHSAVDWDWEVPGVTILALVCAVVLCGAAPRRTVLLGRKARAGAGSAAAIAALLGVIVGIGNQALASSRNALGSQNYAQADALAEKATRWAPWLADPWIVRGEVAAFDQDSSMARRDFRKAIAKDPRNYLAWYGLAGVTSGAAHQEAVAKVVELNPLSDEAKELSKGP